MDMDNTHPIHQVIVGYIHHRSFTLLTVFPHSLTYVTDGLPIVVIARLVQI